MKGVRREGEGELFRIDNGVRQRCVVYFCPFTVYFKGIIKKVKIEVGKIGMMT